MPGRGYFAWADRAFDRRAIFDKPEALKGIRIVELCTLILGPATADYLGEFGAQVIKVELPGTGDTMRSVSPEGYYWRNLCLGFTPENHNKYHITLDVHHTEGKALFKQLVARADVVVENVRPGTMDAWGLGYRQLSAKNPRLIYCALTSYGQFGPKARMGARKPSYDVTEQALSGVVHITGEMASGRKPQPWEVPTKVGGWFAWYAAGAWAAFGILTALQYRTVSGQGQFVDVTGAEGIMRYVEDMVLWYEKSGTIR
ncbi:MAG: CoA transferase, partial [Candidatus Methylomirabilales bacterium]